MIKTAREYGPSGSNPNYAPGHYEGLNTYRECLVEALQHFKLTSFTDSEFWTLAGTDLVEHKVLLERGFKFAPGTYHAVDYIEIRGTHPDVVPHIMNFYQIHELWGTPSVINFDSTIGLVPARTSDFERLIDLIFLGMQKTNKLFVSANFMTGFMYKPFKRYREDPKAVYELYESWLSKLMSQVLHAGMKIEFYDQARHNRRKVSTSSMLGFYALIIK